VLHRAGKRWILNADRTFKSHILLFRAPAVVVVMVGIVLAVGFLPYICEFSWGGRKKNLPSLNVRIFCRQSSMELAEKMIPLCFQTCQIP
jgi:hypothetical protein